MADARAEGPLNRPDRKGRPASREIDDIGDQTLSFQEVKALATGNPLILEKAEIDTEIAALARRELAHHDDQRNLRRARDSALGRVERLTPAIASLEAAVDRLSETRGERFTMAVDGVTHSKRVDAGAHLHWVVGEMTTAPAQHRDPAPIAHLAGHVVEVAIHRADDIDEVVFTVPDTRVSATVPAPGWADCDPTALVQLVEQRLHRLPDHLARTRRDLSSATDEADSAAARLGQTWPDARRLAALRRRQAEITAELMPGPEASAAPETPRPEVDHIRRRLDRLSRTHAHSPRVP